MTEAEDCARLGARMALCRRSRVGAVIVQNGECVAFGNNGIRGDAPSCLEGGCPRGLRSYDEVPEYAPSEGAAKCLGIHAEAAAIVHAARDGRAVLGATMYVTKEPCRSCRVLITVAGIADVVVVSD